LNHSFYTSTLISFLISISCFAKSELVKKHRGYIDPNQIEWDISEDGPEFIEPEEARRKRLKPNAPVTQPLEIVNIQPTPVASETGVVKTPVETKSVQEPAKVVSVPQQQTKQIAQPKLPIQSEVAKPIPQKAPEAEFSQLCAFNAKPSYYKSEMNRQAFWAIERVSENFMRDKRISFLLQFNGYESPDYEVCSDQPTEWVFEKVAPSADYNNSTSVPNSQNRFTVLGPPGSNVKFKGEKFGTVNYMPLPKGKKTCREYFNEKISKEEWVKIKNGCEESSYFSYRPLEIPSTKQNLTQNVEVKPVEKPVEVEAARNLEKPVQRKSEVSNIQPPANGEICAYMGKPEKYKAEGNRMGFWGLQRAPNFMHGKRISFYSHLDGWESPEYEVCSDEPTDWVFERVTPYPNHEAPNFPLNTETSITILGHPDSAGRFMNKSFGTITKKTFSQLGKKSCREYFEEKIKSGQLLDQGDGCSSNSYSPHHPVESAALSELPTEVKDNQCSFEIYNQANNRVIFQGFRSVKSNLGYSPSEKRMIRQTDAKDYDSSFELCTDQPTQWDVLGLSYYGKKALILGPEGTTVHPGGTEVLGLPGFQKLSAESCYDLFKKKIKSSGYKYTDRCAEQVSKKIESINSNSAISFSVEVLSP